MTPTTTPERRLEVARALSCPGQGWGYEEGLTLFWKLWGTTNHLTKGSTVAKRCCKCPFGFSWEIGLWAEAGVGEKRKGRGDRFERCVR